MATGAHTSIDIARIAGFDIQDATVDEVISTFRANPQFGLTSTSADARLNVIGANELPRKVVSKFRRFMSFLLNPLSYVMELAAIIAIVFSNGQGKPPDWQDFVGIIFLLLLNATVGYIEETRAGDAVEALMNALSPTAKVKRDGSWGTLEARLVVPGDIVSVKLGDIVPADVKVIECENMKVDQAAMTGESLPVGKEVGDILYSGSTIKQGEAEGIVVFTGENTFFGKAAALVNASDDSSHFQRMLAIIGGFCVVLIIIFELAIIIVMYPGFKYEYRRGIDNVLVLLIGGVPIAMPTVMSVVMSLGAHQLAKCKAIVTRITAVEEMAAMDILCSDKTGTLTKNKLEISKQDIVLLPNKYAVTGDEALLLSARAARIENMDAIDTAIIGMLSSPDDARRGIDVKHFAPFDPVSKRTQVTYVTESGETIRVSKGAPQIILKLCEDSKTNVGNMGMLKTEVDSAIAALAARGYRTIGVACCKVPDGTTREDVVDAEWSYAAIIPIFDPPRDDSAETIKRALALGVQVKMITGDQLAIAKETGMRLGMGTNMYDSHVLPGKSPGSIRTSLDDDTANQLVEQMDGIAGVMPEDKYDVVKRLQDLGHMVGMTGDGVNDAPSLKRANIGVAVADATDAARGAADIVLTESGLSVIIDAIDCSRRIFQRMQSYCIFAVANTVRITSMFSLLIFAWRFDIPPFTILILALLNDGTLMTISTDRVKPSPHPEKWRFWQLFALATALGLYLTLSTVLFFHVVFETNFFDRFNVSHPWRLPSNANHPQLHSLIYLQVSVSSQAMIFSTRSRWFWFSTRPSLLLLLAFIGAQLAATLIAVYADWGFSSIQGIGWKWALVVWVWCIVWFIPMDLPKILIRQLFFHESWDLHIRYHRLLNLHSDHASHVDGRSRISMASVEGARARASVGSRVSMHRDSISMVVDSVHAAENHLHKE